MIMLESNVSVEFQISSMVRAASAYINFFLNLQIKPIHLFWDSSSYFFIENLPIWWYVIQYVDCMKLLFQANSEAGSPSGPVIHELDSAEALLETVVEEAEADTPIDVPDLYLHQWVKLVFTCRF